MLICYLFFMQLKKEIPTFTQSLIFKGKASLFQLKRAAENLTDLQLKKHFCGSQLKDKPIAAESKTELWTESAPAERYLTAGKIHNLRTAIKKLDGLEVPANAVFSFWKHVGKVNRLNNYVVGRELREGCLIPNVGGGLCQLSNALYDAALKANYEIVERRAHTQIVRGSLAEQKRDATVFWIGANLENETFWEGFEVERGNPNNGWLERADIVVLPAFVEHKPRRVLEAAAHKIPVIASKACGLENVANIETIETGNGLELKLKLQNILARL